MEFSPLSQSRFMMVQTIRLISWNIRHRALCTDQAAALQSRRPDIVALQEVTVASARAMRDGLTGIGLEHIVDSFQSLGDSPPLGRKAKYGELIASRWPVSTLPAGTFEAGWAERLLSAEVTTPRGPIEVHTAYIPPGSSNGKVKIETLEGIYSRLACASKRPRVLCGDLNTPQEEWKDATIVTWGQVSRPDTKTIRLRGNWRQTTGERWDRAERNILHGLKEFDLSDVYRSLYGYAVTDFSWYVAQKTRGTGRRFDHVFASHSLNPIHCGYLHAFREGGLSDHSPIEAVFLPVWS